MKKVLIVLPVYNEQLILEKNTLQVLEFCRQNLADYEYRVVIADNNSNDKTSEIGRILAEQHSEIEYFFIATKGKGIAWRTVFLQTQADIYIFMDVDLAVDLVAVNLLVGAINEGFDLAVGSRYLKDSVVARPWFRGFTSVVYRFLARLVLGIKISDFQCGFKAVNTKIKNEVLPYTKDQGLFLDTELLTLSAKAGYKIKEIPVSWSEYRNENRKSTVKVFHTIVEYLIKIWDLKKRSKRPLTD